MSNRSSGRYLIVAILYLVGYKIISGAKNAAGHPEHKAYRPQTAIPRVATDVAGVADEGREAKKKNREAQEESYWFWTKLATTIGSIGAVVAAVFAGFAFQQTQIQANAAKDQVTEAKLQTAQIKIQTRNSTSPFIVATVADLSISQYFYAPTSPFGQSVFDIKPAFKFSNYGLGVGIITHQKCGIFIGYKIKKMEDLWQSVPYLLPPIPNAAVMRFRHEVYNSDMPVSPNNGSTTLQCSRGIVNGDGFKTFQLDAITLANLLRRRRLYAIVEYGIKDLYGQTTSRRDCFAIPNPDTGNEAERRQADCQDTEDSTPVFRRRCLSRSMWNSKALGALPV